MVSGFFHILSSTLFKIKLPLLFLSEGYFTFFSFAEKSSEGEIFVMSVKFQKQLPQVLRKKGVLKNFANFTGKHLRWSLFLIKLQAWGLVTLLKRDSNTIVLKFAKFLRTPIFAEYLRTTASSIFLRAYRYSYVPSYHEGIGGHCLSFLLHTYIYIYYARVAIMYFPLPPEISLDRNPDYWVWSIISFLSFWVFFSLSVCPFYQASNCIVKFNTVKCMFIWFS